MIVNCRFLTQPVTGVQRYAIALSRELKKRNPSIEFVSPPGVLEPRLAKELGVKIVGSKGGHYWEQFSLRRYLKRNGNPICLSLSGLGPVLYNRNIITIHDMAPYHQPNWFSKKYSYWYKIAYKLLVNRVIKVLTVSDFSKTEIIKYLKIDDDRIAKILNVCSFPEGKSNAMVEKRPNESKSLNRIKVLAVSSLEPRKNFEKLIEAAAMFEDDRVEFLIVGKSGAAFQKQRKINLNENVRFLGYRSDEELAELYTKASLFVYPSLYEGFGIPLLEAMNYSCPVACSDIKVFHEVAGKAAIYFDPLSAVSIAEAIKKVVDDEDFGLYLKEEGQKQLRFYSIETEAEKLLTILEELE